MKGKLSYEYLQLAWLCCSNHVLSVFIVLFSFLVFYEYSPVDLNNSGSGPLLLASSSLTLEAMGFGFILLGG